MKDVIEDYRQLISVHAELCVKLMDLIIENATKGRKSIDSSEILETVRKYADTRVSGVNDPQHL